ncbi:unnamed protein product, partial [marine sediment metagenome]
TNILITPELIMEVAEAGEDSVITKQEFSGIMEVMVSIFMGVMFAVFVGMLTRAITKAFTKETGIKTKKVGGVAIPIY